MTATQKLNKVHPNYEKITERDREETDQSGVSLTQMYRVDRDQVNPSVDNTDGDN